MLESEVIKSYFKKKKLRIRKNKDYWCKLDIKRQISRKKIVTQQTLTQMGIA